MADEFCPDCGEVVRWGQARHVIFEFWPYPNADLRRVMDVFGPKTPVWVCNSCDAFGLTEGLALSR